MPFKSKSATASSTATVAERSTQKFNLKAAIEALSTQLASVVVDTIEIADVDLLAMPEFGQDGLDALAACAKLLGVNYDQAKAKTFKFVVTRTGSKFLSGPQVMAYGESCCVVWGDEIASLAADTSFYSDALQLLPGSKDNKTTSVLVDPAGYCLPLECRLDYVYRQDDLFFSTKLITARSAEALGQYLQRGEPLVKWNDIEDGKPVLLHDIEPVTDDEGKVRFAIMLAEYGGEPIRVYSPGEYEEWAGVKWDEPIEAIKNGRTVTAAGKQFELKGSFTKLRDLAEGAEYKVLGYKATQVTWEGKIIHDFQIAAEDADGNPLTIVSANSFLKDKLSRDPEISEDKSATLYIDSISQGKRGTRVSCRLVTVADEANPFLKRLQAQQSAAQAETENYDNNPL